MNFIIQLIIFLILVFLYLHVRFQLKINNDLEVYEIDYVSNENLQTVCDIRDPVLFTTPAHVSHNFINFLTKYQASLDVLVYDIVDFYDLKNEPPVSLPITAAQSLLKSDTSSKYYSLNNYEFVEESELIDEFRKNDDFFKPSMTCYTKYDYIMGARNAVTPFCYHVDYRRFFCVVQGQICVKMAPWKYEKYLNPIHNFKDFEFYSRMNVWETQPEYEVDYDKVKFLEVFVDEGRTICIPPYWWYSIKFTQTESSEKETVVCSYSYKTVMNVIAITPKIYSYIVQKTF